MLPAKEQFKILEKNSVNIFTKESFLKKLESGKPLNIKLGADPTAPDLHLGHAVILGKMAEFQTLGHNIIFIIGDFTAMIGDPTGKSKTRPSLSKETIAQNAKTYLEQVFKILDKDKTKVVFNSQWLNELSFSEVIQLAGKTTLARIIEREDFSQRLKKQVSIGFHELIYPLVQAYDSVELKADVEIGGTDQTFNLLFGRHLQEQMKQAPQVVMTFPLLEGTDGVEKMSKSLGNYIGLAEDPVNAYGKLMSVADNIVWKYLALLLQKETEEIAELKKQIKQETLHPMNLKKNMAFEVIKKFWDEEGAIAGRLFFEQTFQNKDYSLVQDAPVIDVLGKSCWIVNLLREVKSIQSSSEAKRLIEAGSVSLDEKKITEFKQEVNLTKGMILKIGKKKIFKLT
jgi:tyrosyl-tRNA synthetase